MGQSSSNCGGLKTGELTRLAGGEFDFESDRYEGAKWKSAGSLERQQTAYIRDKIAASKRKGIWMGGPVPLGYEVDARKLVVNPTEAELVRHILASPDQSIAAIAASHGRCRTRLVKLAAIGCLAPDIVTAIVEGREPATLTARTLQDIELPLAWTDQRALLGFG